MKNQTVIDSLQLVSSFLGGRRPSKKLYDAIRQERELDIPNSRSICKIYQNAGGWRGACESAGFDVSEVFVYKEHIYSDEEMLSDIKKIYDSYGEISYRLITENTKYSYKSLERRFGGIEEISKILNIPFSKSNNSKGKIVKHFSIDEKLELLRTLYKKYNIPLYCSLIEDDIPFNRNTFARTFGSFQNACIKAGVPFGCMDDKESQLLDEVEKILSIKIEREYSPEWLINPHTNRKLRFDGFINKGSGIAIEIDGYSHSDKDYFCRHFHRSEEDYKEMCFRDEFKNFSCMKNNVLLFRFEYPCRAEDIANKIKHFIGGLK